MRNELVGKREAPVSDLGTVVFSGTIKDPSQDPSEVSVLLSSTSLLNLTSSEKGSKEDVYDSLAGETFGGTMNSLLLDPFELYVRLSSMSSVSQFLGNLIARGQPNLSVFWAGKRGETPPRDFP